MTIAVGFTYDQGIVLCADTKITTDIQTSESKLAFFCSVDQQCCFAVAISGNDMDYARSAVDSCWEMIQKLDFSNTTMEIVHHSAQFALAEFYEDKILNHPDRSLGVLDFKLLVGIWLKGETRLFMSRETLLIPVPNYQCVGSGAYLANYLIRQYVQANPSPPTLADAAFVASLAVDAAMEHDPHCGGENEILIIRNNGDCGNAYETAMYPNSNLAKRLQFETWRLIHDLAHCKQGETNAALEAHFERVRKINTAAEYWPPTQR
jgi:20S proteasome alpha/beta subunit